MFVNLYIVKSYHVLYNMHNSKAFIKRYSFLRNTGLLTSIAMLPGSVLREEPFFFLVKKQSSLCSCYFFENFNRTFLMVFIHPRSSALFSGFPVSGYPDIEASPCTVVFRFPDIRIWSIKSHVSITRWLHIWMPRYPDKNVWVLKHVVHLYQLFDIQTLDIPIAWYPDMLQLPFTQYLDFWCPDTW